ncbi:MAG: hypothetical protein K8T25_03740 [Planctomycetia bacterium]|nr:hypothetical protein [Planctomycetia bacterium]
MSQSQIANRKSQIAAAAGLVLVLTIFLSARPLAAQAPATDPAAAAPAPPSENEVWRSNRPDLPQEEVMERLRNMHGKPGQKA